jgi:prepilin-type N-terminal cleavage/methylation domain-containing protein
MNPSRLTEPRSPRGFTLIELLVAVAIIGLASALAIPMYADAIRKGRASALQSDGKTLHGALMAYYKDNSAFPSDDSFDTTTLSPLSTEGYLHSGEAITSKLVDGELLVYLAPDIGGADQQFVAVMRHADDRRVIVGVVHTNLVTDDGEWVDGSYVIDAEDLEEAELE